MTAKRRTPSAPKRRRRSPDFVKHYGGPAPPTLPQKPLRSSAKDALREALQEVGRLRVDLQRSEDQYGLAVRRLNQILNSGQLLDRFLEHLGRLNDGITTLRAVCRRIDTVRGWAPEEDDA